MKKQFNKRFNKWTRRYTFLRKGEIYCNNCQGHGAFETISPIKHEPHYEHVELKGCGKCEGEGKLDWVSCLTNRSTSCPSISYRRHKNTAKVLDVVEDGKGDLLTSIKEK